jgi:hypothetical protein
MTQDVTVKNHGTHKMLRVCVKTTYKHTVSFDTHRETRTMITAYCFVALLLTLVTSNIKGDITLQTATHSRHQQTHVVEIAHAQK